ncbi:MAG: NfeD family protein [Eubacterium sp.]|nr:NfeD family protein [Eubacterium sp.]
MEFFDTYGVMTWLILFVIFLIIELVTMGLTTIWFAGGALVAFIAGEIGADLIVQIVAFFAVSIVLLIFTRPLAAKYFNKGRVKTNAESLIGQTALVTEEIDNLKATGKAVVQGMEWTARAENDEEIIGYGTKIKINAIQGVKLIVVKKEEDKE